MINDPNAPKAESMIGSRVQELSQRAGIDSGGMTRLDHHVNTLHEMNNQLDRHCMHLSSVLDKLRGAMPEEATNCKVAPGDPPVMDSMSMLDNEIMMKIQRIAQHIEELRELI